MLPPLDGLNWSSVRAAAKDFVAREDVGQVIRAVEVLLDGGDDRQRQFATYVLGFTSGQRPDNLDILHAYVVPDANWEVQEALAQAFDAYCFQVGYEMALPVIDAWLGDEHPHARRAVTEGLRPWTSKRRGFFARQPLEAIRRLAALRADPSEYVRHSTGNALRDIRRSFPDLVDAETARWDLRDPLVNYTYQRVLKVR